MVTIRRFEVADGSQVQQMITSIMNQEFKNDTAAYPTDDLADIAKTYGGIGEAFFVAVNSRHIVGTIAIKKEDDRTALMRRLFVDHAYRQKQIGSKLIDRALHFCREVGYDEVMFKTTSRMKAALQVCSKKGFVQRARLKMGDIELLRLVLSIREAVPHR